MSTSGLILRKLLLGVIFFLLLIFKNAGNFVPNQVANQQRYSLQRLGNNRYDNRFYSSLLPPFQLSVEGLQVQFTSLNYFIVCSQGGQSASNSNRSATELKELLRKCLTKASDLKHLWVSLPILVRILPKFAERSKPFLCHSNTGSMLYFRTVVWKRAGPRPSTSARYSV